MALTLYGAPLSPYVRKTICQLRERGLEFELVPVTPLRLPDDYRERLNPLGRIPALKDGDKVLADSGVLGVYLERAYPGVPLYPLDPYPHARTLWFEKYADYELGPLCTFVVFRQRFLAKLRGMECDEKRVQIALGEELPPHFDYLNKQLAEREFFVKGAGYTVADIAVASQVRSMHWGGEQIDAERWPHLAAHYARTTERPAWVQLIADEAAFVAKLQG